MLKGRNGRLMSSVIFNRVLKTFQLLLSFSKILLYNRRINIKFDGVL